ncbi:MAG: response regulator transcription factor [Chloroflexota bacterium]|nr:response regulator transcription factor [Chloroflexota bacterium]MDE2920413.1 response regulator transcription factor [Chloroflexota bacterium]
MTGRGGRPLALVIEDDLRYVRQLRADLAVGDFAAVFAGTGGQGLHEAISVAPDVVLLDLGLPDIEALSVFAQLRASCDAPVIAMSAREDDDGIAGALEAGIDDYLAKPFDLDQLLARLRAVLWRAPGAEVGAPPPFESDGLSVDFAGAEVTVGGRPVALSAAEFRLLRFLARNRDRVFRPAQLVEEVWGPEYAGDRHLTRVYVGRVREKIERDPGAPRHLVTRPGVGYMLRKHE